MDNQQNIPGPGQSGDENNRGPAQGESLPGAQPPEPSLTPEVKNLAMLCHLLGLVGILGPLIGWLVLREKHPFIDQQGKEAVNFQISMLIYFIVAFMLIALIIGILLVPALVILNIVFVILAIILPKNWARD